MAANDNRCTHQTGAVMPGDHDPEESALLKEDQREPFIESLPFASQFIIWGARVWVTALKLDQPFETVSTDTFHRLDLLDAGQTLDEFFGIIAQAARRQIDIRCVRCRFISPDEMLFHNILSAAQNDQAFQCYSGLRQWLAPTAARRAFNVLIRLGVVLRRAKLVLSPLSGHSDDLARSEEILAQTWH